MTGEARLVKRIQRGESGAFEELLDAYGSRVLRLVRRYTTNPCDAEDIVQEVFIDIARGIGTFRGDSAVMTWVYRIAVNHCMRHRQGVRPESVSLDGLFREPSSDGRFDPERCAERSDLARTVYAAMDNLTEDHRDVIVLHELHGLTYLECAATLEIPVGTVKSRLSNAFRRMRENLRGYVGVAERVAAPIVESLK